MGDRQHAIALYNEGVTATNDKNNHDRLVRAYQLFASACVADPTYALAWYQLGNNNYDLKQVPAAIAAWRNALNANPDAELRGRILTNLGWGLHTVHQTDEALDILLQAIRCKPVPDGVWTNLSVVYGILDQNAKSVECAEKAFKLAPDDINSEISLAYACMFDRQLARGLKHYERRFEWRLTGYLHAPYPRWEGQPGKTVYLMSDQGLGDTLSFARFVKAACERAEFVHASVHPELMRLFSHAFLGISNLNLIPQPNPFPPADYWSTFMSLPAALGLDDRTIIDAPHIASTHIQQPCNWRVPDRKLHVGISWAGSPLGDIDKLRNIPLPQFLDFYRVPGLQLYGLQIGDKGKELYDAGCSSLIRDLAPYVRDVVDTLSVLRHLDMVICVESALAHICGLAGTPCWVPYSHDGHDFRVGHSGKNAIWYPHNRYWKQGKDRDWQPVFDAMIAELSNSAQAKLKLA